MENVNADILRELCDQYGGELDHNNYTGAITASFYDGVIEVSLTAGYITLKTSDPNKTFFSKSNIDLTDPRSLKVIGECIAFYDTKIKEILSKIASQMHKYGMTRVCDDKKTILTIASTPVDSNYDIVTLVPFVTYNGELKCEIYVATKSSIFTNMQIDPDNIDPFMADIKNLMIKRSYNLS